jgi:hypothetical protein
MLVYLDRVPPEGGTWRRSTIAVRRTMMVGFVRTSGRRTAARTRVPTFAIRWSPTRGETLRGGL